MGLRKASKIKETDKSNLNNKTMATSTFTETRFNKRDEA